LIIIESKLVGCVHIGPIWSREKEKKHVVGATNSWKRSLTLIVSSPCTAIECDKDSLLLQSKRKHESKSRKKMDQLMLLNFSWGQAKIRHVFPKRRGQEALLLLVLSTPATTVTVSVLLSRYQQTVVLERNRVGLIPQK
jgi:hypothetical protein